MSSKQENNFKNFKILSPPPLKISPGPEKKLGIFLLKSILSKREKIWPYPQIVIPGWIAGGVSALWQTWYFLKIIPKIWPFCNRQTSLLPSVRPLFFSNFKSWRKQSALTFFMFDWDMAIMYTLKKIVKHLKIINLYIDPSNLHFAHPEGQIHLEGPNTSEKLKSCNFTVVAQK